MDKVYSKLSIMMFLQFFVWGAWFVSIPTYVGGLEHMGNSIFYCYGAIPIAAMIAPFFLGLVADRLFNTEKILGILFLFAGIFLCLLPVIGNMEGTLVGEEGSSQYLLVNFLGIDWNKSNLFNWIILLHALCFMPTLALTASLSFKHLSNGSKQFPLVRLWGTFGWIFGGLALILLNTTDPDTGKTIAGESTQGQFWLAGIAALLLGLFCFTLPKTPAPKKGEKIDVGALFFMDVWKEFKNPSFTVFVLCSFLLCIPLQAYYAYLQNQMKLQGFLNYASWKNAGTWLEAFMMFAMPFFFRKLGVKKMILIGISAWVLRYALFPLAAGQGIMENFSLLHPAFLLIIGGVLLHGICYDFFFVTGQVYVDQATNVKIRGQAQSMLIFFTQGLGMYIGAEFVNNKLFMSAFGASDMGTAYSNAANPEMVANWSSFWWPLCATAAVIFVIFLLFFKHKDKDNTEFTH